MAYSAEQRISELIFEASRKAAIYVKRESGLNDVAALTYIAAKIGCQVTVIHRGGKRKRRTVIVINPQEFVEKWQKYKGKKRLLRRAAAIWEQAPRLKLYKNNAFLAFVATSGVFDLLETTSL